MPALPAVPGVVQVEWGGTLSGTNKWLNRVHIAYTGAPPSLIDLTAYATNIAGALVAQLTPLQPAATTIDGVTVVDLSSALGAVGESFGSTPGTRAGGEIPGSAAALVSYRVLRRYRGGHPRTYLPVGVTTDLLTQSTWQAAFVTAVGAAIDGILVACVTTSGAFTPSHQVSVSYYGGAPPVDEKSALRAVPIVDAIADDAFVVSAEVASQRRRIGRR